MGDQPPFYPPFSQSVSSTDPTISTDPRQPVPATTAPPKPGFQYQFPVHPSRPQQLGSAAAPPVLAQVSFQPSGILPPQRPNFPQQPGLYPRASSPKEESKDAQPRTAFSVEEEKKEETSGVKAYLSGIMQKGKEMIKANTIPLPPDDPKISVRKRMEQCTGWADDYEKWTCSQCTLENSSEYFQCEACLGENGAVKTILDVIGRGGKKHEKGKFEELLGYMTNAEPTI